MRRWAININQKQKGDYLKTAVAIAEDIGIISVENDADADGQIAYEHHAVDCGVLRPVEQNGRYISDAEIDSYTSRVKIFARAKPEDKMEIVKSMQRQGLVCAMTGDGVNDAPALHQSDIGVAMGLQGTDVAKNASEMVLADDNFVSIVMAIQQGRVIYANIQRFLVHILAVHMAEVLQIFICLCVNIPPVFYSCFFLHILLLVFLRLH